MIEEKLDKIIELLTAMSHNGDGKSKSAVQLESAKIEEPEDDLLGGDDDQPKQPTLTDVQDAIRVSVNSVAVKDRPERQAKIKAILAKIGVARASELPLDHYEKFLNALKKVK